jgi:hypothetical protein
MDKLFRFAYIASFSIYLAERLSYLYDLTWLYAAAIAIFIASVIIWMLSVILAKMLEE